MKVILFCIALVLHPISFGQGSSIQFDFVLFGEDTLEFSNPIDIGTIYEFQIRNLIIHFTNIGNQSLEITSLHGNWSCSLDNQNGVYLPGESGAITCRIAPRLGPISGGEIWFSTNDLDNPTIAVKSKGKILPNSQFEECQHQIDSTQKNFSLSGIFAGYRNFQIFDSLHYPNHPKQLKEGYTLTFKPETQTVKVDYFVGWFNPSDSTPSQHVDDYNDLPEQSISFQKYYIDTCYLTIEFRNYQSNELPPYKIQKLLIFHILNKDELVFVDPEWKKSKYKESSGHELCELSISSTQNGQ